MARKKSLLVEFTVIGSGPFPIDMLRRDSCFPHGEEDAARINSSCAGETDHEQRSEWVGVRLLGMRDRMVDCTRGGKAYPGEPSIRRWNRFGWFVVEVDGVETLRENNGCGWGVDGRKSHFLVDLWEKIKPGLRPNGRNQERTIEEDRMNEELASLCNKCRCEQEGKGEVSCA